MHKVLYTIFHILCEINFFRIFFFFSNYNSLFIVLIYDELKIKRSKNKNEIEMFINKYILYM